MYRKVCRMSIMIDDIRCWSGDGMGSYRCHVAILLFQSWRLRAMGAPDRSVGRWLVFGVARSETSDLADGLILVVYLSSWRNIGIASSS